jgi:hypothetical protein
VKTTPLEPKPHLTNGDLIVTSYCENKNWCINHHRKIEWNLSSLILHMQFDQMAIGGRIYTISSFIYQPCIVGVALLYTAQSHDGTKPLQTRQQMIIRRDHRTNVNRD